jgi:hypothetical protein
VFCWRFISFILLFCFVLLLREGRFLAGIGVGVGGGRAGSATCFGQTTQLASCHFSRKDYSVRGIVLFLLFFPSSFRFVLYCRFTPFLTLVPF